MPGKSHLQPPSDVCKPHTGGFPVNKIQSFFIPAPEREPAGVYPDIQRYGICKVIVDAILKCIFHQADQDQGRNGKKEKTALLTVLQRQAVTKTQPL